MLPILKKSRDTGSKLELSPWHPNFRDFERLPDTKVVRTSFFINGVALLITCTLLLATLYREYTLFGLRTQIEAWDSEILKSRPGSERAIAQYKLFQAEEEKVLELKAFTDRRFVVSDFLVHLGETLPENLNLTQIDARPTGIVLRGVVRGSPEKASGQASAYVQQFLEDPTMGPIFNEVLLTNASRSATGELVIELNLRFPEAPQKGGKK